MTRDEAFAAICAQCPWFSKEDLEDFLACSDDERVVLIRAYKASGVMPTASSWDTVIAVLKVCAEVAGYVLPIVGAVGAVYGVAKAVSAR